MSLVGLGDLVAKLVQGLLRLVDDLIGCVVGVDLILVLLILSGELLGDDRRDVSRTDASDDRSRTDASDDGNDVRGSEE